MNLFRNHDVRANTPIPTGNATQKKNVRKPGHEHMTINNISMHHNTIPNISATFLQLADIRSVSQCLAEPCQSAENNDDE